MELRTDGIAIVLAAGKGSRMKSKIEKQYMDLAGKPVVYYSLAACEKSAYISDVILVVGPGQEEYCRRELVDAFGLKKVRAIIEGGKERYESVNNALSYLTRENASSDRYVLIQDGARPFLTEEIIVRCCEGIEEHGACVAGMPSKDTIKVVDENTFAVQTPDRSTLWQVQTPQAFRLGIIAPAYADLMKCDDIHVTDDAMVLEQMRGVRVKLVEGSYENIKITTPGDLVIAEAMMKLGQLF